MSAQGWHGTLVIAAVLLCGCVAGAPAPTGTPGAGDEAAPLHDQPVRTVRIDAPAPLPGSEPLPGPAAVMTLSGPGLRREEGGVRGGAGAYEFSGSESGPNIVSWKWSFGDGKDGPGVATTHSYESLGVYPVRLAVLDGAGAFGQVVVLLRIAVEPDPWNAVRAKLDGVPCDSPVPAGRGSSKNVVDLAEIRFEEKSGHGEIDVGGDVALVGRFRGGGFEIVDISDPMNPVLIDTVEDGAGMSDVKISPDNFTAVAGGGAGGAGVVLTDIRYPQEAEVMSRTSMGQHMHFVHAINGEQYVFVVDGGTGTGVKIWRMDGPPDARKLTRVSTSLPVEGGPLGPHDIFVMYDEDLKKHILYAADGFHGWLAHDVTDPAKPLPIGGLVNPAEAEYVHSIHAAKVDNRRLVVTASEIGPNMIKVYDATILAAPILLGVWQNTPGLEPQHDLQIVDGRLFVAHYVYGVYVLDLRKLGIAPVAGTLELKPVAHWDLNKNTAGYLSGMDFSGVWDVVVDDGVMYMSNMEAGMHVAAFACFTPGDPKFSSVG